MNEIDKAINEAMEDQPMGDLEPIGDTRVAPATGIAAIALNMALKFHDINTVQDGLLYQQYKLEGRNFTNLHLDNVFETAARMEAFLLGASERIASLVVDEIAHDVEYDPPQTDDPSLPHIDPETLK